MAPSLAHPTWRQVMETEPAAHNVSAEINYRFIARACVVLGLSGLIFGYDIGVISGALPIMSRRFGLTPVEEGLVVSLLAMGSTCGGLLAGLVCDRIGRKRTIHVQNLLFAIGTLTIVGARGVRVVMAGRFVLGFGAAFSAVASLAYLCEVAPLEIRGLVTSTYEMLVVTGILIAWVVDYLLTGRAEGWRYMFGGILLAIAAQALGVSRIPESPRWLLARGDVAGCKRALRHAFVSQGATDVAMRRLEEERLHANVADDAARELDAAKPPPASATRALVAPAAIAPATCESQVGGARASILPSLWLWRLPLGLGLVLGASMHFSGGVIVRNFAGEIFLHAGVGERRGGEFLLFLGLAKFFATAASISLVELTGRRPLLLSGIAAIAAGMAVLTWAFRQPPLGAGLAPLLGCACVIVGYSFSYGPLVWLLWAELFPTAQRGLMIGLASFLANLAMFVNNFLFPPLADALGSLAPVFAAYTALNVLALALFFCVLPETKGRPPEDIRENLRLRLTCAGLRAGLQTAALRSPPGPSGIKPAAELKAKLRGPPAGDEDGGSVRLSSVVVSVAAPAADGGGPVPAVDRLNTL